MVFPVVMYGWMWDLDHKENWGVKDQCIWTVLLEKALESPLDFKEIHPVHSKENQSWIFIGRTDAKAEAPILWPPDEKNWFTGKDPDAGKDWRQEEKGLAEDEMVGWHHWLNGHESEQAPRVGDGQGSLACWSPWGHKESDMTELNWTEPLGYLSSSYCPDVRALFTLWTGWKCDGNVVFSVSSYTLLPRNNAVLLPGRNGANLWALCCSVLVLILPHTTFQSSLKATLIFLALKRRFLT